jgi:hypothetical protein
VSGVPVSGVPVSGVLMSGVLVSDVPVSGVLVSGVPVSGVLVSGVLVSGVLVSGVLVSGVLVSGVCQRQNFRPLQFANDFYLVRAGFFSIGQKFAQSRDFRHFIFRVEFIIIETISHLFTKMKPVFAQFQIAVQFIRFTDFILKILTNPVWFKNFIPFHAAPPLWSF